ncbi:hypothetical protein KM295_12260 [Natronomonas sp. F2-12]|uniref:Uncharacterized protein n=1 Tax=Natronomonas aquatica TaxID=2841590 RepID=A0A9R1D775_9EURY|nr:hypothetical protein [Natronomonas aquatica]MCQ4334237.1 hypothetical protein [Natronomonas aquatica]
MSQAEPLYVQEEYSNFEDAHRNLIDVISGIKTNIENNSGRSYSVAWATETRNHGSEYEVVGVKERTPDDTLQIEGASRGGKYDIIPHYEEPPRIRYHHPSFGDIKWEEEAAELIIMAGMFEYDPEEGFLDWAKERLPL